MSPPNKSAALEGTRSAEELLFLIEGSMCGKVFALHRKVPQLEYDSNPFPKRLHRHCSGSQIRFPRHRLEVRGELHMRRRDQLTSLSDLKWLLTVGLRSLIEDYKNRFQILRARCNVVETEQKYLEG